MKRALLIINPKAGKKRIQNSLFVVTDELAKGGYETTVRITEYSGHATRITEALNPHEYDIIVCSGGDGTLNEVASGVIRSKCNIPIGYIPTGSTNDFAATLGLSKNIATAASDIINGKQYSIDIGKYDDRYFSYVASFGIFTKASYATSQKTKNIIGSSAYVLEGIRDIGVVHEYKMHIEADETVIDDTFIFGAVTNTTLMGGIISIDPTDVALDDGKFEYLLIKKPKNLAELAKAVSAITSCNYNSDQLYFGNAKQIKICAEGELDWSLDGEHAVSKYEVTIENLHNAIKIILPKALPGAGLISNKTPQSEESKESE